MVEELWPQISPWWSWPSRAHLPQPLPEVRSQKPALSRPPWDLEVGRAERKAGIESRCFGESGPGGLQSAFSRCCVDMAIPTPATCLRPLVTPRPFSQEKTPQGACSVTVTPVLQPETEDCSRCSAAQTPPWEPWTPRTVPLASSGP